MKENLLFDLCFSTFAFSSKNMKIGYLCKNSRLFLKANFKMELSLP